MALIDFPNVPNGPGVPDLRRTLYGVAASSGVLGKLQGLDTFGLLNQIDPLRWGVLDERSTAVLVPDSVTSFEYIGGAAFEQQGNTLPDRMSKVQKSDVVKLQMTCSGNGQMTRSQFLKALGRLKADTGLCTIVTPDQTYLRMNLESFDYNRRSGAGLTLITVQAQFKETREPLDAGASTKTASATDPVSTSTVKPAEPTADQSACYNAKASILIART